MKINIIYEDNHLLVVEKPVNMPIDQDSSNDPDLLNELKKYLKEKYNKPGEAWLGLVHRLDRPVGGVCVFAKTSKAASRLSEQIRTNKIHKTYCAVVLNPKGDLKMSDTLKDYLLKDNRTNMTRVDPSGKYAELSYDIIKSKDGLSKVSIDLKTGRSHQIRVQFASRNHPLYGDHRYNKAVKDKSNIALYAYKLSFKHPVKDEIMEFELPLPDIYPFNI